MSKTFKRDPDEWDDEVFEETTSAKKKLKEMRNQRKFRDEIEENANVHISQQTNQRRDY